MARSLSSLSKEELNLLDLLAKSFSRAVQRRASITTRMHQAAMANDFAAFDSARRQEAEAALDCADCLTTMRVLKQLLDLDDAPSRKGASSNLPSGDAHQETTPQIFLHRKP